MDVNPDRKSGEGRRKRLSSYTDKLPVTSAAKPTPNVVFCSLSNLVVITDGGGMLTG